MRVRPPFFDPNLDGWKIALLVTLFVILLIGALTWYVAPWGGPV